MHLKISSCKMTAIWFQLQYVKISWSVYALNSSLCPQCPHMFTQKSLWLKIGYYDVINEGQHITYHLVTWVHVFISWTYCQNLSVMVNQIDDSCPMWNIIMSGCVKLRTYIMYISDKRVSLFIGLVGPNFAGLSTRQVEFLLRRINPICIGVQYAKWLIATLHYTMLPILRNTSWHWYKIILI